MTVPYPNRGRPPRLACGRCRRDVWHVETDKTWTCAMCGDRYDPGENSTVAYDLALALMREMAIRDPEYAAKVGVRPEVLTEDERRWAEEGPVAWSKLESLDA